MPITHHKMCISGDVIELYITEKPIVYGKTKPGAKYGARREAKERENFDLSCQSAIWRAKSRLKRLCRSNVGKWTNRFNGQPCLPIFITLTFADNVTDTKLAARKYSLGIMRLNDHWNKYIPEGIKYVVVPERQKRGAIHYHALMFNLPWIPNIYNEVRDIWGHGHTIVKSVRQPHSVTRYLLKYLSKDMKSGRDFNGKRYFACRGLLQPVVIREPQVIAFILRHLPADCVPYIGKPMEHQWLGKIEYRCYETKLMDVLEAFKSVRFKTRTAAHSGRCFCLNNDSISTLRSS